ncbi:hypothetical protein ACFFNY_29600 [Paenibacillus hodogayensis]|uniref:Stage III sporulation protein AD n=1 Tax=Paenibacillus hodogayensis TaxID=279208 RepID=A0ABV5W5S1_9BACL
MWKIFLVIAVAAAACSIELPGLFRRSAKSAALYIVMIAVGIVLSIAAMQRVSWPSPFQAAVVVFKPINDWLGQLIR